MTYCASDEGVVDDAAVLREIRNVARITKADPLVPSDMILAVRERVDCLARSSGRSTRPTSSRAAQARRQRARGSWWR